MTEEIKDEELNQKLNTQNNVPIDNNGKPKKEKKEKLKPKSKYEKNKLRPLTLVAFILSLLVTIALSGVVIYLAFQIIVGVISKNFDIGAFFNEKVFALTLGLSGIFAGIILVLLYGVFILALVVCFYTVFYSIRTNINLGRLLFASDKDYMKNNLVYRAIYRGFWMLLLALLTAVYFFATKKLILLQITSAVSSISLLAMIILLFIDLIKAKKNFKKIATEEEYDAEVEYKRSINSSYFKTFMRRRLSSTNWTDLFRR